MQAMDQGQQAQAWEVEEMEKRGRRALRCQIS